MGRKSWKRRWFRLNGETLQYYKAEGDKRPIRSIAIPMVQRVRRDKENEMRVSAARTRDRVKQTPHRQKRSTRAERCRPMRHRRETYWQHTT